MKKILFTIASFIFCYFFCLLTYAQTTSVSTEGKEFYAGFMQMLPSGTQNLRLVISSRLGASGTISMPANAVGFTTINFTVAPNGTFQSPNISAAFAGVRNENAENKGFYIKSNTNDISVTAINLSSNRTEASIVLPISALGNNTDYIINTTQQGNNRQVNSLSEFIVVATKDNTTLEITPSALTTGNKLANLPFVITLQRGQMVQYQTLTDFTGTKIRNANGNCSSFAVFAGTNAVGLNCFNINTTSQSVQHNYEQQFPTHTWGLNYIVTPYAGLTGAWYRIVARDNNTTIKRIENTSTGVLTLLRQLNAGDDALFSTNNPICISADKPISVIQITQNSNCNGFSGADASLLVLNANNQNITNATFNTIELGNLGVHYINVIMKTADKAQLRMNGRTTDNGGNSLQSYFFVAPCSDYSYASIPVGIERNGIITTNLSASSGFSAFAYGYSSVDVYAYTVGASFENQVYNFESKVSKAACGTTELSFTGTGTNILSYAWDFGDGTPTETGQNPKHTYTNSGLYKVTMNVTLASGVGCGISGTTGSITKEIQVDVPQITPVKATILSNPNRIICESLDTLNAEKVDGATYQWYKDNVKIGENKSQLITSLSGNYTVSVTTPACNARDSSSAVNIKFLNVKAKIIGDTLQTFCEIATLKADVKDSTLYSYEWKLNGVVLTTKTATLWTKQNGIYTLTLKQEICSSTSTPVRVVIPPKIEAEILTPNPLIACDSARIRAKIIANATYIWTLDKVVVGTNSPTLFITKSGNYALTVKVGNCSETTLPIAATINSTPIVKILQSSPVYFCSPKKLNAQKIDKAVYTWLLNNMVIPNQNTAELLVIQEGIYRVRVDLNGCVATSDTVSVLLNRVKAKIIQGNTVTYCEKGILQADSIANLVNPSNQVNLASTTYQWFLNGKSLNDTSKIASIFVTESGSYQLRVKQENCEETANITVNINKFPANLALKASAQSFCPENTVTLETNDVVNTNPNPSQNVSYLWKYNGKNLAFTTPKITVSEQGTYTVTITLAANCTRTLQTEIKYFAPTVLTLKQTDKLFTIKDLIVYPNPVNAANSFVNVQTSKESGTSLNVENATDWKNITWFFEGNVITEWNEKTSILPTQIGNYQVKAVDKNACLQMSAPLKITPTTLPDCIASLTNMLGQTVTDIKVMFPLTQIPTIDLSNFSAGVYILRIRNSEGERTFKIVKTE
jgi:PKD repeat protein